MPPQPFRFLDLPPEIRTKIFILIVQSPLVHIPIYGPFCAPITPSFPHSLLLTCTQIYHELRPLYFIHNAFSLLISRHNESWQFFLSPSFRDNRLQIQSLEISILRWGPKRFFFGELVPVVEDCILNGRLRYLTLLVRERHINQLKELSKSKRKSEGEELEHWKALKRICSDPYLKYVVLKQEGRADEDPCENEAWVSMDNLKLLAGI